jgi:Flp pilus assembly protein TadG
MSLHAQDEHGAAAPPRSARQQPRLLDRFRRNQKGATAIEFAMLATPFFLLLVAIFETALMFWTTQILEEAATQTSRRLLTGQSHQRYANAATQTADFKNDLCANAHALIDCSEGKMWIDVRTYASFDGASTGTSASNPVSGTTLNTNGFGYNQPQSGQIVVVRVVMRYPVVFNRWNQALVNLSNNEHAIIVTTAFRAEPYANPATPSS